MSMCGKVDGLDFKYRGHYRLKYTLKPSPAHTEFAPRSEPIHHRDNGEKTINREGFEH